MDTGTSTSARFLGRSGAALLLTVVLASCSSQSEEGSQAASGGTEAAAGATEAPAPPAAATVLDCLDRVESPPKPREKDDLVAGPFTYHAFYSALKGARRQYREEGRSPGNKIIAGVRPGREVTLVVPEDQRDFMFLQYLTRGRLSAVTLRACQTFRSAKAALKACDGKPDRACRGQDTQFAGGLYLDIAKANGRDRCAVLEVWVKGNPAPLRRPLFPGNAEACG